MVRLNRRKIYNVYVWLDTRKPGIYNYGGYEFGYEPFYVGKGKGKRSHTVRRKFGGNFLLAGIIGKIVNPEILVVQEFSNEEEAFLLERNLISLIGRRDKKQGPLANMSDGGEGNQGASCSEQRKEKSRVYLKKKWAAPDFREERIKKQKEGWTKEARERASVSHTGKPRPFVVLNLSKEQRAKRSDNAIKMWSDPEFKRKVVLSRIGRIGPNLGRRWSAEYREKMSLRLSGKGNPMYGQHHSEETKNSIRETKRIREKERREMI